MPRNYDSPPLAVLIVDDDPIMLRMLQAMLFNDRHVAGLATSATEALEKFQSRKWDIVLTDLRMPGRDGAELAAEIKILSPDTPVLIMTGYAGVTDYVSEHPIIRKPFRRVGIIAAFNRAFNESSSDPGSSPFSGTINDPPTQAEVPALADAFNTQLAQLQA